MKIVLLTGGAGNDFALELTNDGAGMSSLALRSVATPAAVAEVRLDREILIPDALLVSTNAGPRLLTLAEVREKVAREADKEETHQAAQQLEGRWLALVGALSNASLHASSGASFLGMTPFPAGLVDFRGTVRLNLNACLVDRKVRLEAIIDLSASCSIARAPAQIVTRLGWRLAVGGVYALPQLSIRLPGPGLRFPSFDLPDFDLSSLKMRANPDIDLGFPTLPGIPLKLDYSKITLTGLAYTPASGALRFSVTVDNATLTAFGAVAPLGNPRLTFDNGTVAIDDFLAGPFDLAWAAQPAIPLPVPLDGVTQMLGAGSVTLAFEVDQGAMALKGVLRLALTLSPTDQPSKSLTLDLVLPFNDRGFTDQIDIGGASTPRSVLLQVAGPAISLGALLENLPQLGSVGINFNLPNIPAPQLDALADLLAAILGAAVRGLAGLARIVEDGLRALFKLLRAAAGALRGLDIRLILDARTGQIQQVLLGLHRAAAASESIVDVPALSLTAPTHVDLALLIDLRDGERDAYLVATVEAADKRLLSIGSDLWFGGAGRELQANGMSAPPEKLIAIEVKAKANAAASRFSFVPVGVRHGEAVFFYALETPLPVFDADKPLAFTGYQLRDSLSDALTANIKFDVDGLKTRFLPFLSAPKDAKQDAESGGLADMLKQYIEIRQVGSVELKDGVFACPAEVRLKAMGSTIDSTLLLQLDSRRMSASVRGGLIKLSLPEGEPLKLLGMQAVFVPKKPAEPALKGEQFVLDLGGTDPRLYLNDAYNMVLEFDQLGKDAAGKALRFEVARLVVHSGGMDLEASLAGPYTIPLNGLETDFTFDKARIQVRGGRIESFSLTAAGKLPPALMGDVDVGLQLDFGERPDGSVGLLKGAIELKNKGKPIRSEQTHFVLTLDALSVRVFDDGGGLHFCAFISGGAKFTPEAPALADGMLKNLAGVELKFTDCPVCGASDVIARELEKLNLSFMVTLDEPVKASLFELFFFEVRSIGFEPRCNAFDDRPAALVVGGQVSFAPSGDIVRAECDFHKLYLATPKPGDFLPRLKCEGLGLGLKLGSALEIDGKVVAVDGRMPPDLLVSKAPSERLKGNGFMGQGRIAIQGLPPFAASFGFVEIEIPVPGRPGQVDRKLAWFVYLEAQHLSYHFQLGPVPIYLREAGLGLGYHFTYVGIEAIDNATNLIDMIKAVDTIAATALEPAKLESWTASAQGDLTLVGRLFISMSSASAPTEPLVWKEKEESELPNVLLLNVVAAMRKSTFLMTANVWLGYNYRDWDKARHIGANGLSGKQTMTGYVLLAGARSEFLARVKSNPGAEVGPRLPMPQQFKDALKELEYDATLYIRPGLLHFELGWPNRIRWSKNFAGVNVSVAGGAIFRVHEGAILAGLNLEGNLDFSMSARLDAGCVGVAVSASVYAALVARIIGYLDTQDVGRSLYYSLFSLQIRVKFEVSAWLEIDAWLCKITIRISFAFSLQIDVVAELALQGDAQLGTRVRASIAVSIFGRSLGLSIGLALNPGLVDNAAARVGRFMNMGLLQEVPSVTPDLVQQDSDNEAASQRGQERREARAAAGAANVEGSTLARVPHEDPLDVKLVKASLAARDITATDFQIVLTYPAVPPEAINPPLDTVENWVYLTFLPMDAAPASAAVPVQRSGFYAAPKPVDAANPADTSCDHSILLPVVAGIPHYYLFNGTGWAQNSFGTAAIETKVQWDVALPFSQSTKGSADGTPVETAGAAHMTNLFFAAFRTTATRPEDVTPTSHPYQEPNARPPILVDNTLIARMSESTQQKYDRQEQGYNRNMAQDPADRRCHEARDFLLQKFVSDLFELAADGRTPSAAHVLHIGLTLLVPRTFADALAVRALPVTVTKRVFGNAGAAVSKPCTVFNPQHLMFSVKPPRFDRVQCRFEGNRARLDWDLRWDHAVEPEYFVQHYELTRWIEVNGSEVGTSTRITFKRADKVAADHDGKARTVQRCDWQFTDEFEDMQAADKARLFDPVADVVLRYTVVPVCVSGMRARPCSDFFVARTGMPQLAPIKSAAAIMTVDPSPLPPALTKLKPPVLRLRIDAGADVLGTGDVRRWRLLARAETIVPAGQYGGDGQTERALGGAIAAMRTRRSTDEAFLLNDVFNFPQTTADADRYVGINAMAPGLITLLQDTANPRAFTLLVQSFVLRTVPKTSTMPATVVEIASSALAPVDLGIEIMAGNRIGAMTKVDALELVRIPLKDERYLLDPVAHVDLHARPGRAVTREPAGVKDRYNNVLHPDFGGVVALSWDIRPSARTPEAVSPYRLLSGFDVLAMDLDGGDKAGDPAAWSADRVRTVSSVQLLSPSNARLTPAEVGEPSNWKVRYPSHGARRQAGGAWYSPAESRIVWPRTDVRREPLPEPTSELIKTLLRDGVPAFIQASMVGGTGIDWVFSLPSAPSSLWQADPADSAKIVFQGKPGDVAGAATALRQRLRQLRAEPRAGSWPPEGYTRSVLSGWSLALKGAIVAPDNSAIMLTEDTVPMQFERELHPLLEAIMARMRRAGGRLLDLDRRPAPILPATTVGDFMDVATPELDPYGWAVLDRLGLGVTVRLFDAVDDAFAGPGQLRMQLAEALKDPQLAILYPEAMRQLFVEELLQPGGMMDLAPFSELPERNGNVAHGIDADGLHERLGLSMLRLSVRPAIRKELQYRLWRHSAAETPDGIKLPNADYFLPELNQAGGTQELRACLADLEQRGIGAQAPLVYLRGLSALPDGPGDDAPGGENDMFGRFQAWAWVYAEDASLLSFRTTLRNALGPERIEDPRETELIAEKWASLNARFFEHAAIPGPDGPVQRALGAIEPAGQRKVAGDSAGQITLMLPEMDGYAHQRAFAVLPQWRYARLLQDAGLTELASLLQAKRADIAGTARNYAVAAIERTAPMQPPEVLAVARLGDLVWWRKDGFTEAESPERNAELLRTLGFLRMGLDPGNALPVVLRHHTELRLSKSNVTPARALSLAGSLTTFVLTPADQAWCQRFLPGLELEVQHRAGQDWPAEGDPTLLDQVAAVLGQVPADSKVRVLRHLPHWYKHAVAVSAGAGTAVAETVSAYLADAPARLVMMDKGKPQVGPSHPWRKMLAPKSIRPMPVLAYGVPLHPRFGLAVPALLYRDTTDPLTATLWAGPVAGLPDPGVGYDVQLESPSTELRRRTSAMPLARVARAPDGGGAEPISTFSLSPDWLVECRLAAGPPELQLSLTPMSIPVRAPDDLRVMLGDYPYLQASVLRVPGGWSAAWIDDIVRVLATQSSDQALLGAARLWTALAQADAGLPAAQAVGATLFPSYGLGTFQLVRPGDSAGYQALSAALDSWLAKLALTPGALAALLHSHFTPIAASIAAQVWPPNDPSGMPLAWLDTLPLPPALCGFTPEPAPRWLLPELMTDREYQDLQAAIGGADPALVSKFARLNQHQRERALAGGALRIRATRGDAIALELALVSLT